MGGFRTIHKIGEDDIVINKSRFIGSACPVSSEEEALEFLESVRKKYRDASHHVYAYVIGENSGIQRYSDAGEPSGTAGMPVINVIKLEELRNVVVVVTRYYGGIKLGAGGLVRAYTKGAKLGLDSGIIVDKELFYDVFIEIDYTLLGKVENELNRNSYIIKDKTFGQNVTINVLCQSCNVDALTSLVTDVTSAKSNITVGESSYYSVSNGKIIK